MLLRERIGLSFQRIKANPDKAIVIAKKEFPALDSVVVETAVRRMIADSVHPTTVAITPEAFKTAMGVRVYLRNFKAMPEFGKVIDDKYGKTAAQLK